MEATEAEKLAKQITAGTKEMVEETGKTYESIFIPEDKVETGPTEAERQQFSKQLVDGINEGTKQQLEYDEWYFKTYGTRNKPILCMSVEN